MTSFVCPLLAAMTLALCRVEASAQPVITNHSFEQDSVPADSGYGELTGWEPGDGIGSGYGINSAQGPFADNGIIPHGSQVAFLQQNGSLSQKISGFKMGAQYYLTYRENARIGCCGGSATLSVRLDGMTVIPVHSVISVGEANLYRTVASGIFTASKTDLMVALVKGGTGDVTVLIDYMQITEVPPNAPPAFIRPPQDQEADIGESVSFHGEAVGSSPLFYQWRFNGMAIAGETNTTLTLANVDPDHGGTYALAVTSGSAITIHSEARLTVRPAGPKLINPSFESDSLPTHPGYGTITGWTPDGKIGTGYGINQANGAFADNGAIPHGTRVAFLQDNGTLRQTVSGFSVGEQYFLSYRENARANCCGPRLATLAVQVDGRTVVAEHALTMVGGVNPYRLVTSKVFTASTPTLSITLVKGGTNDATALIDDVKIHRRNSKKSGM